MFFQRLLVLTTYAFFLALGTDCTVETEVDRFSDWVWLDPAKGSSCGMLRVGDDGFGFFVFEILVRTDGYSYGSHHVDRHSGDVFDGCRIDVESCSHFSYQSHK